MIFDRPIFFKAVHFYTVISLLTLSSVPRVIFATPPESEMVLISISSGGSLSSLAPPFGAGEQGELQQKAAPLGLGEKRKLWRKTALATLLSASVLGTLGWAATAFCPTQEFGCDLKELIGVGIGCGGSALTALVTYGVVRHDLKIRAGKIASIRGPSPRRLPLIENHLLQDEVCPICSEDFQKEAKIVVAPSCSDQFRHLFHKECLEEWINSEFQKDLPEKTCPTCRHSIQGEFRMYRTQAESGEGVAPSSPRVGESRGTKPETQATEGGIEVVVHAFDQRDTNLAL